MNTYATKASDITHDWHVVDAEGMVLGRLASEVAQILRGKHKPIFSPHLDTGDFVVVINAAKIQVSGAKFTDKLYRRHSGYPGGLKTETFASLQARFPERIVEKAIKGMLPHNALGRKIYTKLRVYAGPTHPHGTNHPEALTLRGGKAATAATA